MYVNRRNEMDHRTILETEINEQPAIARRMIEAEAENVRRIARAVQGRFNYGFLTARGSSDNAGRYAQYLFGAHNRLPVALATPSLFTLYSSPPRLDGALVIAVSQSGQSPDIVEVVAEGRRQGRPTIAITNDPASPLAEAAEYNIHLHAGRELAVAATKTYTASLMALALLSAALEEAPDRLDRLSRIPDFMSNTLAGVGPIMPRVERYRYMSHSIVIGRGFNYATAFEVALKIKELTRTITEPYSSADFRHGPIAMVRDGFPVMIIALRGSVYADIHSLVAELRRKEAEILIISDDPDLLRQAHLAMPLPTGLEEWLTPLVAVLPGQLFGLSLAQARGLDPDSPVGIQKVTETV
jgi:glucosamine--fructose-6-phosphate aminotransferase (isomerizing)